MLYFQPVAASIKIDLNGRALLLRDILTGEKFTATCKIPVKFSDYWVVGQFEIGATEGP